MTWVHYILSAACLWAIHTTSLRFLGERLPASLITTIFYAVALLLVFLMFLKSKPEVDYTFLNTPWVWFVLLIAGVTIGLTDFLFTASFSKGAPLSAAGPLFSVAGLALMTLSGILLFAEPVTLTKIAGFVLACASIVLLAL